MRLQKYIPSSQLHLLIQDVGDAHSHLGGPCALHPDKEYCVAPLLEEEPMAAPVFFVEFGFRVFGFRLWRLMWARVD